MKNIFFDLDGTIINSEPGLLSAHIHTLEHFGYSGGLKIIAEEGISWTIGPPLGLSVPRLIGVEQATKQVPKKENLEKVQEYISAFQQAYFEQHYKNFILYDRIEEVLRTLKQKGKRLFVCTSKPLPIAAKIMSYLNFDTLLTGLVGAHMDERPHDKSDLLQELCRDHGCKFQESAMIGDRHYDMAAGKTSTFPLRIGVTYGFGSEEELKNSGATHVVGEAHQILEILSPL